MPVQLDRHDRRLLSEDFSSVQAAAGEVRHFFVEIMVPSDNATIDDVASVLLEPAKRDWQTLLRAVNRFRDTIISFEHYGETAFRTDESARLLALITENLQSLVVVLDRARIAQQLDGSAVDVLSEAASQMESVCRGLISFAECTCIVYGVATRATLFSGGGGGSVSDGDPELMPMLSLDDDDSNADSSFDSDDASEDDERELAASSTMDFIDNDENCADEDEWRSVLFAD